MYEVMTMSDFNRFKVREIGKAGYYVDIDLDMFYYWNLSEQLL